jgi:cytochrome c-type biogenesis protein CcmH/NrfG
MAYVSGMKSRPIPVLLLVATGLLSTGVYAAPTKHPKPAPQEQPLTVESLLAQAHDAMGKGDTDLAVRLAQSAIVADPARPSSYVALGDIYASAGQADYARSYYDAALGIDPSEPSALKAIAALGQDHSEHTARANQ